MVGAEDVVDLPALLKLGRGMVKWAVGLMRPRIEFGGPHLPIDAKYKPTVSWWHILIAVKPAALFGAREIKEATVRLLDDSRPASEGIALRWHSRDAGDTGVSERNLIAGRKYLIPVVWRDEADSDKSAYITNENWMLDKKDKKKWPIRPGERKDYHLEIWSGDRKWKSGRPYRIRVPEKETSNGHFTVEIYYGNIY